MTRILFLTMTVAALLAGSPAMSQVTSHKQQQAIESTGESNSQKQLGGLKRDRQITRHILRHERHGYRHAHAQY
ncbi:hypothetical protein [Bradyrhizobium sp. STM 3562]|uniref:hypothetical protein n=1 Tax=Bradyrhizobium sp. STM 3562 TaxID=578924 RepID=UPI00388E8490